MHVMNTEDRKSGCGPVLQLITGLGVGGAERVVMGLSGSLLQQGCPVIVVALNGDSSLVSQYRNAAFPIHLLNTRKTNPFSVLRGLLQLIGVVRRENVAVIHAHMFHALLAGLICRLALPKVRLVFTSHSFAGFSTIRQWLIKRTKSFRAADIVFVKGQHEALNAEHTLVIPNGVLIPRARRWKQERSADRRVFLFVGRLEEPKNPLMLINAFASMKHKRCELWMAGDGTLRETIEQRIESLGLGARVKMLGVRSDISSLFRQADCFVMSSLWEGLPMALLEAGAAALPVIATPVGAIPDVLSDGCGYLANAEDLPKALDAVMADYSAARTRGIRLKERIAAIYSQDQAVQRHKSLYKMVAGCEKG